MNDDMEPTTRERLLDAALDLFAEHGYKATSVGQIEAAAGLTPRAGGFYRHFASKELVLSTALERYAAALTTGGSLQGLLPLGDVHAELLLIGRWTLQHLERHRPLLRILYREGDNLPETALTSLRLVMESGYGEAGRWFASRLAESCRGDAEAWAVAALGSLFHYSATVALFGEPPGGLSADVFVEAWARAWTKASV